MVYLYIGKNTIKVLGFTKTLLGQFSLSHFHKTHSSDFVVGGKFQGVDVLASSIKEALMSASPQPITDKEVCLILPQEVLTFARYTIPADMAETAIYSFVEDKLRTEKQVTLHNMYHDLVISKRGTDTAVLFTGIDKDIFQPLNEALQLLQLRAVKIVPESTTYFTLFEETLRADKKEVIVFASYNESNSFAYVYDSLGLMKDQKYDLGADIKPALKEAVTGLEQEGMKVHRLILSGTQSTSVRQDLFTKDVGAWTNPLEKIIDNFYKEYLKMIIPTEQSAGEPPSVLEYDSCFGAFIYLQKPTAKGLSMAGASGGAMKRGMNFSMPTAPGFVRAIFNFKTLGIFLVSCGITFGAIFALSKMNVAEISIKWPSFTQEKEKIVVEKPTAAPTKAPTPTPSVKREDLKVKIMNGSGTKGLANKAKSLLQDAGYTDIVTGNADTFDYTTTEVQVKEASADAFALIKEDLADYVTLKEAKTLPKSEAADVVIILGSDFE